MELPSFIFRKSFARKLARAAPFRSSVMTRLAWPNGSFGAAAM
jgi:hypothetical protein